MCDVATVLFSIIDPYHWFTVWGGVQCSTFCQLAHSHIHSLENLTDLMFLFQQDLFFKYSWNNFLHFQVELCVAAILNHLSSEEQPRPVLQNLDGQAAASNQEVQEEGVEAGRTSDPQTSIHNALVAHVGVLSSKF